MGGLRDHFVAWLSEVVLPWLSEVYPWLVTAAVFLLVLWLTRSND